jgi:hypothetical protein
MRSASSRFANVVTYALLAYAAFLALNIAVGSTSLVPGYDGLAYVNAAMRVHIGFMDGQWSLLSDRAFDREKWVGLPFTNSLDVLLLALIYRLADFHLGVWLIHTGYLVAFAILARRTLGSLPTALLFAWAVANTFFLQLYTEFVSEMKVGLFLVLFIACLFHPEPRAHRKTLFAATIIVVLLRTIDVLFIVPLVAAYIGVRWLERPRRGEIAGTLKPVALALLVVSPFVAYQLRYVVPYMYAASYTDMARNWKDMAGVSGKWSLFSAYVSGLLSYQRVLVQAGIAAIAIGAVCLLTRLRPRLSSFRDYAIAGIVVLAVLMQAQTTNLMLVYWVYMVIGLAVTALAAALLPSPAVAALALIVAATALHVDYGAFVKINRSLPAARPLMELARAMAAHAAAVEHPVIFQNFAGIGQLDYHGLEVASGTVFGWAPVNNISYEERMAQYLDGLEHASVAFIANRNFLWPPYLGVNHRTEQIAQWVRQHGREHGWVRAARLTYDGHDDRYIDVFVRPSVRVELKYAAFGDRWLDAETTVLFKSPAATQPLDGYALEVSAMVPAVEGRFFQPPIDASLVDSSDRVIARATMTRPGRNTLCFPLDGAFPGTYRLVFDKTFSTKADPRHLSALYFDARLAHADDGAAACAKATP